MTSPPTIIGTRFVLAVQNLEISASYYEEKLGFTSMWTGDGWHFLQRGTFMIMLVECPDDLPAFDIQNHSYFAYVDVQNIGRLFQELQSKQVEILSEIDDKPWGQREFGIRTIDGHRIMFGEKIKQQL